jgi:hypothetical protein
MWRPVSDSEIGAGLGHGLGEDWAGEVQGRCAGMAVLLPAPILASRKCSGGSGITTRSCVQSGSPSGASHVGGQARLAIELDGESAPLVEELSAELEAREATVQRVPQEAQDAEARAALHKDQTEAVRRLLEYPE